MIDPNGADPHEFIAPPPQEVTHPEQATNPAESTALDPSAAELSPTDDATNQDNNITRTRPEVTPDKPEIPPHMLEAASRAIDSALATSSGRDRLISFGKLLHIAFGDEILSNRDITLYERAMNQDPRARYKGKGRYLI
jgi:hypothetical protein